MKKIGMVVAVEMEALLSRFGEPRERLKSFGFPVLVYGFESYELYVLNSGAGEIASAAGTQTLISVFGVEMIINYGVVGGLTPEMEMARTCVVESVVHYDFDTSAWDSCEPGQYAAYPGPFIPATPELVERALEIRPELRRTVCASGDKFVADPEKKRELNERFGVEICEMEAAGIVLTCNRCGVPCLLIKTVSDGLTGGAEEFSRELGRASAICMEIAGSIMDRL